MVRGNGPNVDQPVNGDQRGRGEQVAQMRLVPENGGIFAKLFAKGHNDQKQRNGPQDALRNDRDRRDMAQQLEINRDEAPDEICRHGIRQATWLRGFRFVGHMLC